MKIRFFSGTGPGDGFLLGVDIPMLEMVGVLRDVCYLLLGNGIRSLFATMKSDFGLGFRTNNLFPPLAVSHHNRVEKYFQSAQLLLL